MADLLASLEAQLQGMEDDDSDGDTTTSSDDDDDSSDEDDSDESDEDNDKDVSFNSTAVGGDGNNDDGSDGEVTTQSQAQRRLSETRMDISAKLEAEKSALDKSEHSRASLRELQKRIHEQQQQQQQQIRNSNGNGGVNNVVEQQKQRNRGGRAQERGLGDPDPPSLTPMMNTSSSNNNNNNTPVPNRPTAPTAAATRPTNKKDDYSDGSDDGSNSLDNSGDGDGYDISPRQRKRLSLKNNNIPSDVEQVQQEQEEKYPKQQQQQQQQHKAPQKKEAQHQASAVKAQAQSEGQGRKGGKPQNLNQQQQQQQQQQHDDDHHYIDHEEDMHIKVPKRLSILVANDDDDEKSHVSILSSNASAGFGSDDGESSSYDSDEDDSDSDYDSDEDESYSSTSGDLGNNANNPPQDAGTQTLFMYSQIVKQHMQQQQQQQKPQQETKKSSSKKEGEVKQAKEKSTSPQQTLSDQKKQTPAAAASAQQQQQQEENRARRRDPKAGRNNNNKSSDLDKSSHSLPSGSLMMGRERRRSSLGDGSYSRMNQSTSNLLNTKSKGGRMKKSVSNLSSEHAKLIHIQQRDQKKFDYHRTDTDEIAEDDDDGDSFNNKKDSQQHPYHYNRTPFGLLKKKRKTKVLQTVDEAPLVDKIKKRVKGSIFWSTRETKLMFGVLCLLGSSIGFILIKMTQYRLQQNHPHLKFQPIADKALAATTNQIEQITTSLQHLAHDLQQFAQTTNQTWPFVLTSFDYLQTQASTFLLEQQQQQQESHHSRSTTTKAASSGIESIILAPLVKPRQWSDYQYHIVDTHYYYHKDEDEDHQQNHRPTTSPLLYWDSTLLDLDPLDGKMKPIFVPWQQYPLHPSKRTNRATTKSRPQRLTTGPIVRDWYGRDENENENSGSGGGGDDTVLTTMQRDVWESIEQSNTSAIPRLLLALDRTSGDRKRRDSYDYILQPVIDSVVVKRRLFRTNLEEDHVVLVVAAQLRWGDILQKFLQIAFEEEIPPPVPQTTKTWMNFGAVNSDTASGVVVTVEDLCSGSKTRSMVPIVLDRSGVSPSNKAGQLIIKRIVAEDATRHGNNEAARFSIAAEIDLAAKQNHHNQLASNRQYDCPTASKWRLNIEMTPELEEILTERNWDLYQVICFWVIAFVYGSSAVRFNLHQKKEKEDMAAKHLRDEIAKEDVDPDEVCKIATVIVMGIAGWDQWINSKSRKRSDVVPFMTNLLKSVDQLAAKHKVVKIHGVGHTMVYASGGPDHVNHVLRFARECYGRFEDWKKEWVSIYGIKTQQLYFTSGLGNGSLTQPMTDNPLSYYSGEALEEATCLEAKAQRGQLYLSSSMADTLRQVGKMYHIKSSEMDPSTFWLDFLTFSNKRKLGGGSGRSFSTRLSEIGPMDETQKTQRSKETPSQKGDNKIANNENLQEESLDQSRPDDQPPPIAEIDLNDTSAEGLDLGYEPMEPAHFDDDTVDEVTVVEATEVGYEDDTASSHTSQERKQMAIDAAQQRDRLLDWTVDVLTRCLEEILAARTSHKSRKALAGVEDQLGKGSNILEQCKEFISIPIFSKGELNERAPPGSVPMTDAASRQLRDYVTKIADSYHDHAFHSFEHAANVTASMRKLFNKLIGEDFGRRKSANMNVSLMRDNSGRSLFSSIDVGQSTSYGIKTDPLIKFTIIFCALIHDADHPGVPNEQLILEKSPMATVYKKSIAEQNSVEFAWSLLMQPEFVDLRSAIYSNEKELRRFRQVIVHCVLATDLHDEELQTQRKVRWAKAFAEDGTVGGSSNQPRERRRSVQRGEETLLEEPEPEANNSMLQALRRAASSGTGSLLAKTSRPKDEINKKGTIVMEHLIQAADIAHTMQNWKVYLKWNERLFDEFFEAFEAGRTTVNPSATWYQGELDFFDKIVIPLASKLSKCGIFEEGASEELLESAITNRHEWELHGHEIIHVYLEHYIESHVHQTPQGQENDDPTGDLASSGRLTKASSAASLPSLGQLEPVTKESDGHMSTTLDRSSGRISRSTRISSSQKLDLSGDDAPPLEAGTAHSSVNSSDEIFSDGTSLAELAQDDPDIVFAVLDNLDAPDDFDSYILLTPAQMRQRRQEEMDKDNKTVGTEKGGKRGSQRRRIRRVNSTASSRDIGTLKGKRRKSDNSRASLFSEMSGSYDGTTVSDSALPMGAKVPSVVRRQVSDTALPGLAASTN